jgi:hypothetical protein
MILLEEPDLAKERNYHHWNQGYKNSEVHVFRFQFLLLSGCALWAIAFFLDFFHIFILMINKSKKRVNTRLFLSPFSGHVLIIADF